MSYPASYRVALLSLLLQISTAALGAEDADARQSFIDFARKNAHPIAGVETTLDCSDLSFLKDRVARARIAGIGESRHSGHEFLLMKQRITRCLIDEAGFTDLLLEAGLVYTERIDRYLQSGAGDLDKLVGGMEFWQIYENEEFISMLRWIRQYNAKASPERRIHLHGIDVQDPLPGLLATLAFFAQYDPLFHQKLASAALHVGLFESARGDLGALIAGYRKLSDREFAGLSTTIGQITQRLQDERSKYVAAAGSDEFEWVAREFRSFVLGHEMFSFARTSGFNDLFDARERALAENAMWFLGRADEKRRFVLWSHNNHVAKATITGQLPGGPALHSLPLGALLEGKLQRGYYAIGTAFAGSRERWKAYQSDGELQLPKTPAAALDATLAEVGGKLFLVDLAALPRPSAELTFARKQQIMRSEGGTTRVSAADGFDAILFVDNLEQARYTKHAIEQLTALQPPHPTPVPIDPAQLARRQGTFELANGRRIEFKAEQGRLYLYWDPWKFRVYAKSPDELFVIPDTRFRLERVEAHKPEQMSIQIGEGKWTKIQRVQ